MPTADLYEENLLRDVGSYFLDHKKGHLQTGEIVRHLNGIGKSVSDENALKILHFLKEMGFLELGCSCFVLAKGMNKRGMEYIFSKRYESTKKAAMEGKYSYLK